jgi:hypothetical protein
MQRCICDGGCGTDFRSTTRYWKIDNALLPASVPRHPPLAVSLSTGTTMKESDNLSLCLLLFHDAHPLFVLTLLAGTAIKETKRWVETLAVSRTHSLQLSAYYHHVLEYVCSLTYPLNHLRPLCVTVSYHFGEKMTALHVTYEPFAAVRYRQRRPVRPLSLVLATHCTYTMSADPTYNLS